MPAEIKNLLLTIPLIIILVVMFFWLVKALLSGTGRDAEALKRDEFDRAGYESMSEIRRKESCVMVVGTLVILVCLFFAGALGYWAVVSAAQGDTNSDASFELVLAFIPAVILLTLIITASRSYMKSQRQTMKEFRQFQLSRRKALKEYEEKRKGSKKKTEKKAAPRRRTRLPEKPEKYKKRRPKLR